MAKKKKTVIDELIETVKKMSNENAQVVTRFARDIVFIESVKNETDSGRNINVSC